MGFMGSTAGSGDVKNNPLTFKEEEAVVVSFDLPVGWNKKHVDAFLQRFQSVTGPGFITPLVIRPGTTTIRIFCTKSDIQSFADKAQSVVDSMRREIDELSATRKRGQTHFNK